jgi:hypothetical protein
VTHLSKNREVPKDSQRRDMQKEKQNKGEDGTEEDAFHHTPHFT